MMKPAKHPRPSTISLIRMSPAVAALSGWPAGAFSMTRPRKTTWATTLSHSDRAMEGDRVHVRNRHGARPARHDEREPYRIHFGPQRVHDEAQSREGEKRRREHQQSRAQWRDGQKATIVRTRQIVSAADSRFCSSLRSLPRYHTPIATGTASTAQMTSMGPDVRNAWGSIGRVSIW